MSRLEQIDDALWLAEGKIVSFYGFPYPTRAAIARFEDGTLWVWSPVELDDALRGAVDELGRVAYLVSPNKIHHLYLEAWKAVYPTANLWGPASTIRRHPEVVFGEPLGDSPPAQWRGEIDQAWFRGSIAMDEIVFFHRRSRTAIVADLVQAFSDAFLRAHWRPWQRPLARLDGIVAAKCHAPLEWRLSFLDRRPARAALAKVLAWECDRVVIAHGDWARSDGRAYFEKAFSWLGSA